MKDTTCFCGVHIGEVEIENTNNGGKHDLDISTLVISYTDFTKAGCKTQRCTKCNIDVVIEETPALFICQGYSVTEVGRNGIILGYAVNNSAIADYEVVNKVTINYGVFAARKDRINNLPIFGESGKVADKAVTIDLTKYKFDICELKIVGFNDSQKSIELAMGAYVSVTDENGTEYSYMQHGTKAEGESYVFITYNGVKNDKSVA